MNKKLDLLLVTPAAQRKLYQGLAEDISVKEPVPWTGLLAESCRSKGFSVAIIDMHAENLSYQETTTRIQEINPKLVLFCCYGANPNASSSSMTGAVKTAQELKNLYPEYKISFIGPHVNALPLETLDKHNFIDIVFTNEGVYALHNLLATDLKDLSQVKGIGYKKDGISHLNPPEKLVPQELLEYDLPGMAWDLMPSLDKYRTGYWQAYFQGKDRSPFASIYTSLGCIYSCSFCMINIINKTDNDQTKTAKDFNTFRYWSPNFIIKQLDYLAECNVKYIKIADEMFCLKPKHFLELARLMAERQYPFKGWFYSRIDTIKEQYLEILLKAGLNVAALGIESANQQVRLEIEKGKFKDVNIREVVNMIHSSGMDVGANYIVGLPKDNFDSMQATLDLAIELNTLNMNVYSSTALPGSPLYLDMKNNGSVPTEYSEFGFLSYDHKPTPTDYLSQSDIEAFRDYFYETYWTNPKILSTIYNKYGPNACDTIKKMNKIKLKRNLLENHPIYK